MSTPENIPYGVRYWHERRSRNGIPGDALNSMLQKSIRRGLVENALAAAYEMYITSPDYLEMLWLRLGCIAVEDVGFGNPRAVPLIRTLGEMRREFPYADVDQALFFVHAVRYLCRCTKERTSDHIRGMLKRAFNNGLVPEIPDYALDMHTTRGKEMGRDMLHFAEEASRVENALECEELTKLHAAFLDFCRREASDELPMDGGRFSEQGWQF